MALQHKVIASTNVSCSVGYSKYN